MIIIYHSRDLDGYCSGAICKKKYPDAKLIGYDYGKPIPWDEIPKGEAIIMIDVSLPMPEMEKMARHSGWRFTWIDHHASAIKDYNDFVGSGESFCIAVLEDGIAACEGAWKYLFPEHEMPNVVKWLGQYDTWRNSDESYWNNTILPFQYGMRLDVTNANNFPQVLLTPPYISPDMYPKPNDDDIAGAKINEIFIQGRTILSYQKEQNALAMKGSFVIEFKGLRALCCNGGGFNSLVFESVWDEEKHDLMMPFKFDGTKWTFSMYTTKDIDLSLIAKEMGGGGHKKACGFVVTDVPDFLFKSN